MGSIDREFLSYDDISGRAERVLAEHHPLGTLPVPIEELIEFSFGISLQTRAALRDLTEVEALISHDCNTIYVDGHAWLAPGLQRRLRFSLAHELGHCVLHKDILANYPFSSTGEWKTRYHSIQGDDLNWLEWQANSFAGLLLVPRSKLADEFKRAVALVASPKPTEFRYALVVNALSKSFDVSTDVIEIRCDNDGLVLAED